MLLGGAKDRIRLYNTHVGWLNRPVDELVDLSARAVERDGFTALKLKVGKADEAEIAGQATQAPDAAAAD